jgi:hypothetical protein
MLAIVARKIGTWKENGQDEVYYGEKESGKIPAAG